MLTGKNREEFIKWFVESYDMKTDPLRVNLGSSIIGALDRLPFEMKIGVFIKYYIDVRHRILIFNPYRADLIKETMELLDRDTNQLLQFN